MLRLLNARLRTKKGEEGMAMVMVIAITAVLGILLTAAISYAVGGNRKSATDADWNSALAAAYAGIEEYQSRLAEDASYVRYGNPASTFTQGGTVALPTGTLVNKAFGLGTTGTWATVAGSGGDAEFRYEVDNHLYASTGVLRLRSTGRVDGETRSIVADLKQQGFVDFLYFTDYEIQDPDVSGKPASCVKYAWAGRSTVSPGCSEIQFGSGDVIDGPVHSNDTMRICDAQFKGPVTTAYNPATGNKYAAISSGNPASSCSGQKFDLAGYPAYSPIVGMPSTNSEMKRETRNDLPTEVPLPGCLYTGPTTIKFNSNGTVTVRSPWTKYTRVKGSPATVSGSTALADCGLPSALASSAGATFTPPANNLLFVQTVPAIVGDPNYWAANARPSGLTCTGGANSVGDGNGLGYPMAKESYPLIQSGNVALTTAYGCRNGDVFVQGTVSGKLTVAAENYVYVVDNVVYNDSNADMLGLVGNNAVWVYQPIDKDGNGLIKNTNRRIDAAILSVSHTFTVQNFTSNIGSRGQLQVNGAIAQRFRGPVSQTGGYVKKYSYDSRLRYTAPPKFLSPVSTSYGVTTWVEIAPIFKANGAAN